MDMDAFKKQVRIPALIALVLLGVLVLWYETNGPSGRFYGFEKTVGLNADFPPGVHEINVSFEGIPTSVKISGSTAGDGWVRAYLNDGLNQILVFEDNGTKAEPPTTLEEGSGLSGSLAYATGSQWDSNDNGITSDNGVVDFEITADPVNGLMDEEKLCSEWMVYSNETKVLTRTCFGSTTCCNFFEFTGIPESSWDEQQFIHKEKYGATENTVVAVQVHYVDINLSLQNLKNDVRTSPLIALPATFKNKTQAFQNECLESCNLQSNTALMTLRIEIDNETKLNLEQLTYTTTP